MQVFPISCHPRRLIMGLPYIGLTFVWGASTSFGGRLKPLKSNASYVPDKADDFIADCISTSLLR